MLPVDWSTDVNISGRAVDDKVVIVLTSGPNGILDVVEWSIVAISSSNSEEWST